MRLWRASCISILCLLASACGGSKPKAAATTNAAPLSGNWQFSLSGSPRSSILTGFMLQNNNSVAGSLILGVSCPGVGSVTGTVDDGGNVSLLINEYGQEVSLQGTSSSPLAGNFSNLPGGCVSSPQTGTWSAVSVQPVTGSFKGTFTSQVTKAVLPVNGSLTQGPNIAGSTSTISGTIQATNNSNFCSYISQATVTGLISGTSVVLNLFGPNGEEITQIGQLGQLNNTQIVPSAGTCGPPANSSVQACLLVTPDAKSMSGIYLFPQISSSCPADWGTLELTLANGTTP